MVAIDKPNSNKPTPKPTPKAGNSAANDLDFMTGNTSKKATPVATPESKNAIKKEATAVKTPAATKKRSNKQATPVPTPKQTQAPTPKRTQVPTPIPSPTPQITPVQGTDLNLLGTMSVAADQQTGAAATPTAVPTATDVDLQAIRNELVKDLITADKERAVADASTVNTLDSDKFNTNSKKLSVMPNDNSFANGPRDNMGEEYSTAYRTDLGITKSLFKGGKQVNGFDLDWEGGLSGGMYIEPTERRDLYKDPTGNTVSKDNFGWVTLKLGGSVRTPYLFNALYAKANLGLDARTFFGTIENQYLGLDLNSLGVYLDKTHIGSGFYVAASSQLQIKYDMSGNVLGVKKAEGSPDLNSNSKLSAEWLTNKLKFYWTDVPAVENVGVEFNTRHNLNRDETNPYAADYALGAALAIGESTKLSFDYLHGPLWQDSRMKFEQDLIFEKNKSWLSFYVGIGDLNNYDKKSAFGGVAINFADVKIPIPFTDLVWETDVKITGNVTVNNVVEPRRNQQPEPFGKALNWEGLSVEQAKGPHQTSQDFSLETAVIQLGATNKLSLRIGTQNDNGVPGITFKDPSGNLTTDNTDVIISSVKVYDLTMPSDRQEIKGLGAGLVGATIQDINSGSVTLDLPTIGLDGKQAGYKKFRIDIKLSTDTANFQPVPMEPVSKVGYIVQRQ